MKIVIIGGTGLVGSKTVRHLRARGHDATAASPTTGVNAVTGIGLAEALRGAEVVIDVSDPPSFVGDAALEYFQISGRNLARAELHAGVVHHIALSIVGAARLPNSGYMRAKVAQEAMILAQGVPFTILRATQSFELMSTVGDAATFRGTVRVSPALVQPVAADDIASTLAELIDSPPADRTYELAGPERMRLVDLVHRLLRAQHDERAILASPEALYYGSVLNDHTLLPGDQPRLGVTHFSDWLQGAVATV